MKFEDLKIGMKVKVVSHDGFYPEYVGKTGFISGLDSTGYLDVRVTFDIEDDDYDWGYSSSIELAEDVNKTSEQHLLNELIKNMEKSLSVGATETLETLSRVYQRIKAFEHQDSINKLNNQQG